MYTVASEANCWAPLFYRIEKEKKKENYYNNRYNICIENIKSPLLRFHQTDTIH